MTRITFTMDELNALMEHDLKKEDIIEYLPLIGTDVDGISDEGEVSVELFPDRPDMYSVEGVARAMSSFLELQPGLYNIDVNPGDIDLFIDKAVLDVRPIMLSAVIRDISVDDSLIKSMMQLQEKLHLTVGRRRLKVSVGLHDLDSVEPPFTYKAVLPTDVEFEPLQMEGEYLNLNEILRRHPKGRDYAYILEGHSLYPLFVDRNNQVLSFPPIINGTITTLTENTRNILMDVTGLDFSAVSVVLNIILAALHQRGGKIETVNIHLPKSARKYYDVTTARASDDELVLETPLLSPKTMTVDMDYIRKLIGIDLDDADIVNSLHRMGHNAEVKNCSVTVSYPAYRIDMLHPVDIVEEVAVGYGYMKLPSNLPQSPTFGQVHPYSHVSDFLANIMVGMGYMEVKTLTLSNQNIEFNDLNLPDDDRTLLLKNPLTEQHTLAKTRTLGSLMSLLKLNRHRDMPQRIFEITDVIQNGMNTQRLGFAAIAPKASFTEAKSLFETLFSNLGVDSANIKYRADPYYDGLYIAGRHAQATLYDETIGYFGEVHPEVLERFDLGAQVILGEVFLDSLGFLFR